MQSNPLAMEKFESTTRVKVHHQLMEWSKAWSDVLSIALYSRGPDLSQIGTTWLGSLWGMKAIRPFTPVDINNLNAPQVFLPAIWKTCSIPEETNIYAIPFTCDTRILLYRRDILARCGVDERTAFQNPEHLYETLAQLQSSGVEIPWAVSTVDEIHHLVAPWIWGAGGDFHTPDGYRLSLADPRTIEGIYQFYRLHRFIPPQARGLSMADCDVLFRNGQAAIVYTVHNTLNRSVHDKNRTVPVENIGAAKVPGVPFVGGSQLVIWKHTMVESLAMQVIQYLTSAAYQTDQHYRTGDLPVLTELLSKEPYKSDPLYKISAESLQTGRTIQAVPRWAAVEARTVVLLQRLWQTIFANPDMDLRAEITRQVTEVSERLKNTILAT